jgi:hypothetical protein
MGSENDDFNCTKKFHTALTDMMLENVWGKSHNFVGCFLLDLWQKKRRNVAAEREN